MRKVLILMGCYLPGHKDGGPLRTIVNVTDALGDLYDFHIACFDREWGDAAPYPNISPNAWNPVGKAKVWYVSPGGFTFSLLLQLAEGMDCIYMTSFFESYGRNLLLLKRMGRIQQPVYLASMGVFAPGALAQKALKKKVYIAGCKLLDLFRDVTWSVTSELEAADLKRVIGSKERYLVAEDLPRSTVPGRTEPQHEPMRVVFLSRICAHKGLDIAIDAIRTAGVDCRFTVYGPIWEQEYWKKCQQKLDGLDWHYGGDVPPADVQEKLAQEDVLILPTKSENYGHVIFEVLSVGCIPLISDTTPWQLGDAGFAVPRDAECFARKLRELANTERESLSRNGVALARRKLEETRKETGYRRIFG